MTKTVTYDWSEEAMRKRNFLHYHANRIFRASVGKLHFFPEKAPKDHVDEDETSVDKSILILEKCQ